MLPQPFDTLVPAALVILGQIFVVTSTWALGVTGTFLGDYFGILMDERVEGFPFNVLRDPMYVGSTMCFAGGALWWVCFWLLVLSELTLAQVRKACWSANHSLRIHRVHHRSPLRGVY